MSMKEPDDMNAIEKEVERLLANLIPTVPDHNVLLALRRLLGNSNPKSREDWSRGKTIQMDLQDVPWKWESESAAGLYDRSLRHALMEAAVEWLRRNGVKVNHLTLNSEHPLMMMHKGFRVEHDEKSKRINIISPGSQVIHWWEYERTPEDAPGPRVVRKVIDTYLDCLDRQEGRNRGHEE